MKRATVLMAALGATILTACTTAPKAKDVAAKGMYANAATETVAIGSARLTILPESIEAFVAHYSEDTAWLSPSTKTHQLEIYMTGTNSTAHAAAIVKSICEAFTHAVATNAVTTAAPAREPCQPTL